MQHNFLLRKTLLSKVNSPCILFPISLKENLLLVEMDFLSTITGFSIRPSREAVTEEDQKQPHRATTSRCERHAACTAACTGRFNYSAFIFVAVGKFRHASQALKDF